MAAFTKLTSLLNMIPLGLRRHIEKDASLRDYQKAYDYVIEQIPLHKNWNPTKGEDDMDIGAAEVEEPADDEPACIPCPTGNEDADLDTMKGGAFQGYFHIVGNGDTSGTTAA